MRLLGMLDAGRRGGAVRADLRQLSARDRNGWRDVPTPCCCNPATTIVTTTTSTSFAPRSPREQDPAAEHAPQPDRQGVHPRRTVRARRPGHRARPHRRHRRGVRAPRVPRGSSTSRSPPSWRHARANAGDLVRREDVQHDGMEGRLDVRSAVARRRRQDREAVPHLRERRAVPTGDRRRPGARRRLLSASLAADLTAKRDRLYAGLVAAGFHAYLPEATYFIIADIRPVDPAGDGMSLLSPAASTMWCGGDPQ